MTAETKGLKTVADFVRWAASCLRAAGVHSGHGHRDTLDEALELVLHVLCLEPPLAGELYAARLTPKERKAVAELVERRIGERRPTAYLTGQAWFAGLRFLIDERVLVPRSPIAELVENGYSPWIDAQHVSRVLDLCTGSGCIAVATAVHMPWVTVDATDVSEDALAVAAKNVSLHDVGDRVRLVRSDLFDALAQERYDVIVSNPPYVPRREFESLPAEYGHEPALGLLAGEDGLDVVRRLLAEARRHLTDHGILVVEVGSAADALRATWPKLPFAWPEFARGGSGIFVLGAGDLEEARSEA